MLMSDITVDAEQAWLAEVLEVLRADRMLEERLETMARRARAIPTRPARRSGRRCGAREH